MTFEPKRFILADMRNGEDKGSAFILDHVVTEMRAAGIACTASSPLSSPHSVPQLSCLSGTSWAQR